MRAGAAVQSVEAPVQEAPALALLETGGSYGLWLADFSRRLALHDASVLALARDVAARTRWLVEACGGAEFPEPAPAAGAPPDVLCRREGRPPLCLEVELPETLVRRQTVARLRALTELLAFDTRVVLVAPTAEHGRAIDVGERLLRRARLRLGVAAIAPDEDMITGADW
jgi:hypothetical protein